jgi:hypothetical protein
MAFVVDASITACWAFDDEDHSTPDWHSIECAPKKA